MNVCLMQTRERITTDMEAWTIMVKAGQVVQICSLISVRSLMILIFQVLEVSSVVEEDLVNSNKEAQNLDKAYESK